MTLAWLDIAGRLADYFQTVGAALAALCRATNFKLIVWRANGQDQAAASAFEEQHRLA